MAKSNPKRRKRQKRSNMHTPTPQELSRISGIQGIIDLFCQSTDLSAGIAGAAALQGPTHVRKFCNLVRSTPRGLIQCAKCDTHVVEKAIATGQPVASECWTGLIEIATPIRVHKHIVAVFFVGQVIPHERKEKDIAMIDLLAKDIKLRKDVLQKAHAEIPVAPPIGLCKKMAKQAAEVIGDIIALAMRQPDPEQAAAELLAEYSIVDWLRSTKEQTVLILGKDTLPEIQILRHIQKIVGRHRYKPVLVKDFEDIDSMSIEQKVIAFAQASRFAIIENTFPAGQIDECRLCAMNRIVTVMLRQKGTGSSFLVSDYDVDFPFMKEFVYTPHGHKTNLTKVIPRALEWAEAMLKRRASFYRRKYPWRKKK